MITQLGTNLFSLSIGRDIPYIRFISIMSRILDNFNGFDPGWFPGTANAIHATHARSFARALSR
jgi:hypothetical protein